MSVAQKNKPSTMSSSNVQSIDLPTRFLPNSYILKVFDSKILLRSLETPSFDMKFSKFIRVPVTCCSCRGSLVARTVALPNFLLFRWYTCLLVLFRLLLIALALTDDGTFISVYGYTWKLSCSHTIFHHLLVLLLSYNCD